MSNTLIFCQNILSAVRGTLLVFLPLTAALANPNPDIPTDLEVLQLPKYCHGQFIEKLRSLPEYSMPAGCAWVNHYCYGLNFLNRAGNFSMSKGQRMANARRAREDIEYTKNNMGPSCAIARDVEAAEVRLRIIEMTLK